jgi:hypothetical protein
VEEIVGKMRKPPMRGLIEKTKCQWSVAAEEDIWAGCAFRLCLLLEYLRG